jgi:hypothetical protein
MSYRQLTARTSGNYARRRGAFMSDPMKPDRTWHDIAMELSAELDPEKMMRLAEELNSALERDEATRAQSHEPLTKTFSSPGLV